MPYIKSWFRNHNQLNIFVVINKKLNISNNHLFIYKILKFINFQLQKKIPQKCAYSFFRNASACDIIGVLTPMR